MSQLEMSNSIPLSMRMLEIGFGVGSSTLLASFLNNIFDLPPAPYDYL